MKISKKIQRATEEGRCFWSFEYFPPKTEVGVTNLYDRMERMYTLGPEFVDVTWAAGGGSSELTLQICTTAQAVYGLETCMHLTCTNMPREKVDIALREAKAAGIQNILALRGDPPRGQLNWTKIDTGFSNAIDLVKYIREQYGDYFCIGVAGYPEGHIENPDGKQDFDFFVEKAKLADYIVTQLFYDIDLYFAWLNKVRAAGVTAPILPGIMPIQSYGGFMRMTSLCKTAVPKFILEELEPIKDDDKAVKDYGVALAVSMCNKIKAAGGLGFHFYTLNLEKSVRLILEGLEFVAPIDVAKPLPWSPKAEAVSMWGHPSTVEDVCRTFAAFCKNELAALPWCDQPMTTESIGIRDQLASINRKGFLTINSQPAVDGALSSDPVFGWGPRNGFVYQKAYLEFFVSPKALDSLIKKGAARASLTFHAVNKEGDLRTNNQSDGPNAVTWGVFPGQEIIQPTVVDPVSFMAWKDEAFELWMKWASTYDEDSPSYKLIKEISDTWFLVNVVDNNYRQSDIFCIF
ncbi:hypothetical protein HK405_006782 [Cladochytrium tenue]|nr:hypothetical protein HK405_006782 [Cladochytrium tenue]